MTDTTDFTLDHYSKLIELAKATYKFIGYSEISPDQRFVLWRHDCDFSLNRALRLARLEQAHQVRSTYFLNPHCEFYNLLEKKQAEIVENILGHGHDIGLHFDATFYQARSEDELDALVAKEAGWLKDWFGVGPTAFSFHNPDAFLLTCERDSYGGLINCYSRKFKDKIPYCSDSNGYWRYRRLHDVLARGDEPRLQVLTHPGWWQDAALYPRQRMLRSVFGRADAAMRLYDDTLQVHGRENLAGPAGSLAFLKELDSGQFSLLDYLWHKQAFQPLFLELSRMHNGQLISLCKAFFGRNWGISAAEVELFLLHSASAIDGALLFERTFGTTWAKAVAYSEDSKARLVAVRNLIARNAPDIDTHELQDGCVNLCGAVKALARWGTDHPKIHHDGIVDKAENPIESATKPVTSAVASSDWAAFKSRFQVA